MIFFRMMSEDEKAKCLSELRENKKLLESKIIPESYPDLPKEMMFYTTINNPELLRDEFISISSYLLVANDWLRELLPMLENKKCLEIMSGNGMLAYALKELGINIIPTDNKEWEYPLEQYWCQVETLDAVDAIVKYGRDVDVVICSWIPYGSGEGTKALLKMREVNSNLVMINIGELGGCCGDNSLRNVCNRLDNSCVKKANLKYKSWYGIHDAIYLIN